jgi:succinate dehydrogenase/fumarate reductase flavoprotein subunit
MVYTKHFLPFLEVFHAAAAQRTQEDLSMLLEESKQQLLTQYHPDSQKALKGEISYGPNKGELAPKELADLLEASSRLDPDRISLETPDFDVDVLVVGAGGAGAAAAITAQESGASVLLTTKLRYGDSNTVMATGLACALARRDSPVLHFLDTLKGSQFTNDPKLVGVLANDAPQIVAWLLELGVNLFIPKPKARTPKDKSEDPKPEAHPHAKLDLDGRTYGGHSISRAFKVPGGITGVELTRVFKEELHNRKVPVLEFHPIVDLLLDENGRCAGAVLQNVDTEHLKVVRARTTILATGGMGRLHCGGFPTSNHYGATGDGLVVGYRAGAQLVHQDSVQYHPTGIVWPDSLFGWLLSENFRGKGVRLLNSKGQRFINEMETRDVVAAAIIRECAIGNGVPIPSDRSERWGVWFDIAGAISNNPEAFMDDAFTRDRILKSGIDLSKEPLLIYPTQHYQNGGLRIDSHGRTTIENLYAAGEVAGGVHGRNRLGGNSLTDVLVFGRRAGRHAALASRGSQLRKIHLQHVAQHNARVGNRGQNRSPMIYPEYPKADPRRLGPGIRSDRRYGFE